MKRERRRFSWKTLRICVQIAAVALIAAYFLYLVYPLKVAWRPDLLFQLDPLTHLYLLLAGHGLPQWAWALAALVLLFAVSRLFCGWLCPLGALLDFVSGVRGRLRLLGARGKRHALDQPTRHRALLPANFDIYLLVFLLVLAAFRKPLLWLLDPIVFSFKFLTVILLPVLDAPLRAAYNGLDARLYMQDWWRPASDAYQRFFTSYHQPTYTDTTLFLLCTAAIIGLEFWQKRFWCRYICPLGALLRLTYKLHPLRRRIRPDCSYCLRCEDACHFGGTPEDDCLYCMECIESCAPGKISFLPGRAGFNPPGSVGRASLPAILAGRAGFNPPEPSRGLKSALPDIPVGQASCLPSSPAGWKPALPKDAYRARIAGELQPDGVSRRLALQYAAGALVAYPVLRLLDGRTELPADFIRPPGVLAQAATPELAEALFTELCIKCGQCMKACLTNGLQPALTEAGLSALWTPRLISRLGYCEFNCNLCGLVCPTGAIPKLALAEKQKQVLGTAYFDRNRCIPFITPHNCTVCEEHCPTAEKAILMREAAPPFWPPDRAGNAISGSGESAATPGAPAAQSAAVPPGTTKSAALEVKTLQPYIDPALCIGCGICEKVCPVPGLAAVRVLRLPLGSAYSPGEESSMDG
jgi:ferredoxin